MFLIALRIYVQLNYLLCHPEIASGVPCTVPFGTRGKQEFTLSTELKMTEWKTTVHILASSQSSIAAQQKIVLADGSLCSRQQIV